MAGLGFNRLHRDEKTLRGCQKEIATQIIESRADYVLSLKGNQGTLHEDVEQYFAWAEKISFKGLAYSFHETLEKDHGRIEERWCSRDG